MARPGRLTPLARIVDADAQLASWNDRRLREEALLRAVRRVLPRPVAERVFISNGQGETLELSTTSGAVATVVRQRTSELLAALQREGCKFIRIRLRVQPRTSSSPRTKTLPRQWDSASARPLEGLAAALPAGPLKAALGRLLRRSGR
jgi:hypothetical protein